MQDVQDNTRTIPVWNRDALQNKVNKINRRCERFGWDPVSIEWGEVEQTYYTDRRTRKKVYYNVIDVTITTPPVRFDGWRFIATLESVGEKNIMSAVPGETVPDAYRTMDSKCDHCGTIRRRNNTYVLAHEDGRYTQVGSSCINDFLGGHNALAYAGMLSYVHGLVAEMGDMDPDDLYAGEGGPRVSLGMDLLEYMATVATVIRVDGWLSKGRAYELGLFGHSTSETAINLMDSKFLSLLSDEKKEHYTSTPEDKAKANDVVAWLQSDHFDPDVRQLSDYEWNLSTVAGEEYIAWKHTGLAASAFACYDRFRGVQAEIKRSKQQSAFVGEVKERLTLTLTVDIKRFIESDFGVSVFYVMHDVDGNKFIAFYSGSKFEADEGDIIDIKGTVKKHELDSNGIEQTVLTRIAEVK
jgi:hypothetical protein